MAWVAPPTFVSGNVLTAAQLNILSGNLAETAAAKATAAGQMFLATGTNTLVARTPASAIVTATESTTSSVYTDLATVGPSVTVATGTKALIIVSGVVSNNTVGAYSNMGVDITGASAISPANPLLQLRAAAVNQQITASMAHIETGLTAGNNTFTCKYQIVTASTGAWALRQIIVIPLS